MAAESLKRVEISSAKSQRRHILVALHEGSGNIPPILAIVERLIARGHDVRVMPGPRIWTPGHAVSDSLRARVAATGAIIVPFAQPPTEPNTPPRRGVLRGWTPAVFRVPGIEAHSTATVCGAWATNVAAELRYATADAVAADHLLLGPLVAAEALGVPAAVLVHTIYPWPTPGLPPYGPGWLPARGPLGRLREALGRAAEQWIYAREGRELLNTARAQLGLGVLPSPLGQYARAARVLVLTSPAFDLVTPALPPNARHVGWVRPQPGPAAKWTPPWPADDPRPLVLVSLSTAQQGQAALLQRVVDALGALPVRGLVTVGPALDQGAFRAPANVALETFVPHARVMPLAAVLVSQCGHGTVVQALAHGVPLVCVPLRGDQHDVAARVVHAGAGVRLRAEATVDQVAAAVGRVLAEPRFQEAARRLAVAMTPEDGAEVAADEVEALAHSHRRATPISQKPT
jgi:UDP:flavonoid glycosyltransferase YjiC (YdhE family)